MDSTSEHYRKPDLSVIDIVLLGIKTCVVLWFVFATFYMMSNTDATIQSQKRLEYLLTSCEGIINNNDGNVGGDNSSDIIKPLCISRPLGCHRPCTLRNPHANETDV